MSESAHGKLVLAALSTFVVAMMVLASEISQKLQTSYGYKKPFFLTYFHTSFLSLLVPAHYLSFRLGCHSDDTRASEHLVQKPPTPPVGHDNELDTDSSTLNGLSSQMMGSGVMYLDAVHRSTGFPVRRLSLFAIGFMLLWFGANYLFTIALAMTSVASGLCLEQSTTIFVFVLSVVFLAEKATFWKVLSVGVCLLGVVLVGYGDQMDAGPAAQSESVLGDVLVIACALAASVYMVAYKRYLRNLGLAAVTLWLGCIGLACLLLLWPGLILLHFTHLEAFELPSVTPFMIMLAGTLASFLFNYALNWGIAKTQPLFMRLVTVCSIPVGFVVDQLLNGWSTPHWARIVGAVLVIIGFLLFSSMAQGHAQLQSLATEDDSTQSAGEAE